MKAGIGNLENWIWGIEELGIEDFGSEAFGDFGILAFWGILDLGFSPPLEEGKSRSSAALSSD